MKKQQAAASGRGFVEHQRQKQKQQQQQQQQQHPANRIITSKYYTHFCSR
jgi:hypothetical protein